MIPNHLNEAQRSAVRTSLAPVESRITELHHALGSLDVDGSGDMLLEITNLRGIAIDISNQLFSIIMAVHRYWDHNRGPYVVSPPPASKPTLDDISI